jgi:L-iditol 2-dehydrogenase
MMLQANLINPKDFMLEEVEIPEPKTDEALIRVVLAGICGSDIHAYYGKHPFISCPIVPGHEFVGIVEKVGDGSTELLEQRVTVLPSLVCGECYNCRTGHFNICENLKVIGCQAPGAFAEYVVVPKDKIFPLPNDISWKKGVLVEPLAVAVHAVRRVAQIAGKTVLVLGAGTIGLMTILTLKAYGAGKIIVSDFNDQRLDLAKEMGADLVVNPNKEDLQGIVKNNTELLDVTFECVGVQSTINSAIEFTRKGGDVIVLGVYEDDVVVKMGLVQDKEINMLGSLMYTKEDYFEAIRLIGSQSEITKMITHSYGIQEIDKAFRKIENSPQDTVKVVIEVDKEFKTN